MKVWGEDEQLGAEGRGCWVLVGRKRMRGDGGHAVSVCARGKGLRGETVEANAGGSFGCMSQWVEDADEHQTPTAAAAAANSLPQGPELEREAIPM